MTDELIIAPGGRRSDKPCGDWSWCGDGDMGAWYHVAESEIAKLREVPRVSPKAIAGLQRRYDALPSRLSWAVLSGERVRESIDKAIQIAREARGLALLASELPKDPGTKTTPSDPPKKKKTDPQKKKGGTGGTKTPGGGGWPKLPKVDDEEPRSATPWVIAGAAVALAAGTMLARKTSK